MTREEAIKIIDCYDIGFYDLSGEKIPADKLADAFDMAIEALSAEAVQIPIKLEKRYQESKDEDITDAFMRGYLAGRSSAESVHGWIPCSERLPRENGVYIVSLEDAVYPWATFHNGGWFMLSVDNTAREFGAYEVIAWMPLPTPYKGGDSE